MYLNDIKLLQESIINASMKQEDGEYIKENIHFRFVMSQIIQEAFDKPFAFFHLHSDNHDERSLSHQLTEAQNLTWKNSQRKLRNIKTQ